MYTYIRAVLIKEFRQLLRDRRLLGMLILAPCVQLLLFGYAVSFEVDHLPTVICDFDRSERSRSFARSLVADRIFVEVSSRFDCAQPEREIASGNAKVVVMVQSGFSRDLASGRSASLQALIDGTDPVVGRYAANTLSSYGLFLSQQIFKEKLEVAAISAGRAVSTPSIVLSSLPLFNPTMKSAIFIVPGVSAMLLLVVTMLATSMGLARERELGVLEQVMVTPLPVSALLIGKILPFVAIGLFDVLVVLVVSVWVFDVPVNGSLFVYFIGTLLFLLSTLGLGLFVSTISANQQQAFLTGFLIMMPAVLLSGVMTPIATMPAWLQPLTFLNPIRYYVEILRGVLLKGSSLQQLQFQFGALIIFGVLIFAFSALRFSKRLA